MSQTNFTSMDEVGISEAMQGESRCCCYVGCMVNMDTWVLWFTGRVIKGIVTMQIDVDVIMDADVDLGMLNKEIKECNGEENAAICNVTIRVLGSVVHMICLQAQLVELPDGRVLANMRNAHLNACKCRGIAVSHDGGASFGAVSFDPVLVSPVCMATILRAKDGLVYFANPASTIGRVNGTLRRSVDGLTWSASTVGGKSGEGRAGWKKRVQGRARERRGRGRGEGEGDSVLDKKPKGRNKKDDRRGETGGRPDR